MAADADGLVDGVDEFVGAKVVDRLAVEFIRETGVVSQAAYRVGDVGVSGWSQRCDGKAREVSRTWQFGCPFRCSD